MEKTRSPLPTTPCNTRGAAGPLSAGKVKIEGFLSYPSHIDLETLLQVGHFTVVWRAEASSYGSG